MANQHIRHSDRPLTLYKEHQGPIPPFKCDKCKMRRMLFLGISYYGTAFFYCSVCNQPMKLEVHFSKDEQKRFRRVIKWL